MTARAPVTPEALDATFALLEEVACNGERCPQSKPFGPLNPRTMSALAHAGRICIEIFFHNWRVVTIMEGPHLGRQTMRPPKAGKPYRAVFKGTGSRPQPSLARFSFDE